MSERNEYGTWGLVSLIITLIITKVLISSPSFYAKQSASAGWLEVMISGIFEIFMLFLVLRLVLNFEKMDLVDIAECAFGRIGKIIVGVLSVAAVVISASAVFRCFCELIRNTVIRGISYDDVSFFILAASLAGAYLGVRKQVNLSGLILPILLVAVAIILLINVPRYSITNILPISGVGVRGIIKNALLKNASFYEIGIILFFLPYLKDKTSVKKTSFTALSVSVILSSIIALQYQLAVPYEAAGSFSLPLYQMTRMIKAGTFFQRIEPLNIFIWSGAMYLYVGIGIRMSAHIYKKTFSISETRPMVFVFALLITLLALIPGSETNVERIYDFILTYGYVAYPLLPLLILISASMIYTRKKEV